MFGLLSRRSIHGARLIMSVTLVIGCAAQSRAQTMVSPAFTKDKPAADQAKQTTKIIKLRAAAEPDPALRYRFWPAPELRRQGNPMPFINRAILISVNARHARDHGTKFIDQFDKFASAKLDQLPVDEVRAFLNKYGATALGELERAENLVDPSYDLRMDELSASEMIATVLPELQESRTVARILSLRARLAVKEQRWNDFVRDVRLGFRLAESIGYSNDFLIGRLISYAISDVMMGVVEEAIQQPGCPNLYWALASMPETKLSEIRDSIEFESGLISRMFGDVRALPETSIGEAAARGMLLKLFSEVGRTMDSLNISDGSATAQMVAGFYVVTMAEPARELLAETDSWGKKAYELSAPEAVLRGMQLKFDRIRDNWTKWSLLPPELWRDFKDQAEMNIKVHNRSDVIEVMVAYLTPAIDAARRASRRMVQSRNLLLTMEALRMHAAAKGQLPESIENLRPVPAWDDGLALKPFSYTRSSPRSATLLRQSRYTGDKETTIQIQLIK